MRNFIVDWETLPVERHPERPLFAIGDIHGFPDALAAMQVHLKAHIRKEYGEQPVDVVYLGDFIDRGPDSVGAMRLAMEGIGLPNVTEVSLMGNHDQLLAKAAELAGYRRTFTDLGVWLHNGGYEALESMGFAGSGMAPPADQIRHALGPELCGFVDGLKLTHRNGDFLCVHAGVDPMMGLDEQLVDDLVWVREPFLSLAEDPEAPWTLGVTVVHGHTPGRNGLFAHRIGVDAGGFFSGIFLAVEIWDGRCRFHAIERG